LNWNFPTHENELSYNIMLILRKELMKFNNSRTRFVPNMMIQGNDLTRNKFQEIFIVHGFPREGQEKIIPKESN
jgi:hypothetical protein